MEVLKTKWLRFSSHLLEESSPGELPMKKHSLWAWSKWKIKFRSSHWDFEVVCYSRKHIAEADIIELHNTKLHRYSNGRISKSSRATGQRSLWLSEKDTGVNGALSQHQSNLTLGACWIVTFCPCKNRGTHSLSSQPYISLMKTFLTQFVLITKPSSLHFDSITQSTFPKHLWRWTLQ